MAMSGDVFIWTPAGGSAHMLAAPGQSCPSIYADGSEDGFGGPPNKPMIEDIPALKAGLYRTTAYSTREYYAEFVVSGKNMRSYLSAMSDWESWHLSEAEGILKRVLADGRTRYLTAVPIMPDWGERFLLARQVRQGYRAANPWWHDNGATMTSTFNGANPVNVSCVNAGAIPTWPIITITGIVNTPKLANSGGDYIQIAFTTVNADDTLIIDCRPGEMTAGYYVHGVGVVSYKARSSASKYITLPTGTHNVILTAASGTPAVSIHWHNLYGSLY
jgi:hypothetical protein